MALHADLRIAAHDASFSVPPASLGLAYPPEATHRLVALVGPAVAKQLLYTAGVIDADEARRIGLVQEIHALTLFLSISRYLMAMAAEVDGQDVNEIGQKAAVLATADYVVRFFLQALP
mgnify:CR=1 FL=1